ncbi:PAPD5_7 [Lepeophtheirus salmonis]|uniref:PAPD5_7 n=1 Tax=Lepeophtheirus salmonis TaxID=72036 RepID=A0A7R8CPN5_LEPSM|nr:PAPD5_7 [Lepeophtheirus salmonis]CAF2885789.1 PAPD5_7 [Lepeophtheirus salmonis]
MKIYELFVFMILWRKALMVEYTSTPNISAEFFPGSDIKNRIEVHGEVKKTGAASFKRFFSKTESKKSFLSSCIKHHKPPFCIWMMKTNWAQIEYESESVVVFGVLVVMNLGGPPPPGFVPLMGGHFKGPPPREERLYDKERRRKLCCIYSRIPWIKHGSLRLPGVLGLHQEIEDFYAWMLPTTLEHAVRLDVVERIRSAINELYPAARVEISGSFRTGLYLPTSDIDLVICGKVLDKAAVPIVKLTDIRSDIKVDISFNMSNGVRAAELIKHFKKLYPSLPKLIYVLKQFLLQRDLNEVFTGGLSSYSLILLVISYLQHHYSQETASSGRANLGVMLIEILELYGRNFNFMNTAIRITDGGSYISKTKFQKVIANGYAPALLSIEDPLDHTNDVGRRSYGFVTVQNSFDRAFAVLTSLVVAQASIPDGKSILNSIVEIPEDVSDYRSWMRETFTFLGSPHNYNNFTFPARTERTIASTFSITCCPCCSYNGNDLSDCLSSVSTGTCPSHSSPLDSLSDTDSEVLIGPTLTPHSAMGSTSGRHSDATANGALLLGGTFKHPSSVVNSHHKQHPPPSSHHSKTRPPVNRNSSSKHSSLQKDVGRSDSVMNWRSPEREKKVNNGGTPVKQKKKHKKNHNKSSFKYNHQKVKENEKCIDSKDNNSCYPSLEGKESSQQPQQQHQPPPSVPHHRNHQSMNKSSTKKRKKAHLNKGGGGLSSPTSPQQIDSMVVVSEINKSIVINASHHHPHHHRPFLRFASPASFIQSFFLLRPNSETGKGDIKGYFTRERRRGDLGQHTLHLHHHDDEADDKIPPLLRRKAPHQKLLSSSHLDDEGDGLKFSYSVKYFNWAVSSDEEEEDEEDADHIPNVTFALNGLRVSKLA